jgi:hypothetical protein
MQHLNLRSSSGTLARGSVDYIIKLAGMALFFFFFNGPLPSELGGRLGREIGPLATSPELKLEATPCYDFNRLPL